MPERLDRVLIQLADRRVTITWAERDELLSRLRGLTSTASIVTAFAAVGASRPVQLDAEQRGTLLSVVRSWHDQVGRDKLPPGIVALRDALADEFSEGGSVGEGWWGR
jgi:hypothetical protein